MLKVVPVGQTVLIVSHKARNQGDQMLIYKKIYSVCQTQTNRLWGKGGISSQKKGGYHNIYVYKHCCTNPSIVSWCQLLTVLGNIEFDIYPIPSLAADTNVFLLLLQAHSTYNIISALLTETTFSKLPLRLNEFDLLKYLNIFWHIHEVCLPMDYRR